MDMDIKQEIITQLSPGMPPMSAPPHLGMMVPGSHDYNSPNLHDMGIVKTEPHLTTLQPSLKPG